MSGLIQSDSHRLFDLIPTSFTGRPTHYIIHAHGAPFQGLLSQLLATLRGNGAAAGAASSADEVFVWIDFVAVSQHLGFNEQVDLEVIGGCINACAAGVTTTIIRVGSGAFSQSQRGGILYHIYVMHDHLRMNSN